MLISITPTSILICLIIILIICIVIKIITPKTNISQFSGLVNRQIINSTNTQPLSISENLENENPENPNDDKANQTIINLNKINNETNEKIETFLFLDSPFKSSLNYIIVTIENIILKLFKTKSGYIVTNKEVNKIYVPYKQKLQPAPFNPYMPVSRIPKYVYMNVIPYRNNSFYLRKGDYYYYPYGGGLYSWYHWNNYKNKKETCNLIQSLYDKIKHLEEKAFSKPPPPPLQSRPQFSNPNSNSIPLITITNTNSGNNKTELQEQLNKLPELDTLSTSENNSKLGSTNIIEKPEVTNMTKINDAPSEELTKAIKTYSEPEQPQPEIQPQQPQPQLQQPEIQPQSQQPELTQQEQQLQPQQEQEPNIDEIQNILNSPSENPSPENSEIPELPKETFWSKFGF